LIAVEALLEFMGVAGVTDIAGIEFDVWMINPGAAGSRVECWLKLLG